MTDGSEAQLKRTKRISYGLKQNHFFGNQSDSTSAECFMAMRPCCKTFVSSLLILGLLTQIEM